MDRIPNLPNEIWKPINGYEKYYVSSLGRIKSLKHKKEKILAAFPNNKPELFMASNERAINMT